MASELIRIDNYKPTNRGCVVADVDITIMSWNLQIKKIQECVKGDKRWFNWPSYCEGEGSEKKWHPYIDFEFQVSKDKLFTMLRERIDALIAANPELVPKAATFSDQEMPF